MTDFVHALQRRYAQPDSATPPGWAQATPDALVASLLGHRTVRAYLPDPVSDAHLHAMLAAAQSGGVALSGWA